MKERQCKDGREIYRGQGRRERVGGGERGRRERQRGNNKSERKIVKDSESEKSVRYNEIGKRNNNKEERKIKILSKNKEEREKG